MSQDAELWLRLAVEASEADEEQVSHLLSSFTNGQGVEILDRRAAMLAPEAAALAPGRVLVRAYLYASDWDPQRLDLSGVPGAVLQPVEPIGDDWREGWKRFFKATRVGQRFVVRPPWDDLDSRVGGEIDVVIEPGMAFGTGTHETTRLCLDRLEGIAGPGVEVFDVGCGSGVLSVACALLGAGPIRAVDIDTAAVAATYENAARNGATGIEASVTPIAEVDGQWDLVIANILSSILVTMKDDLLRVTRPGGDLLLSGILEEEAAQVAEEFEAVGLIPLDHISERDWACLHFRRPEA